MKTATPLYQLYTKRQAEDLRKDDVHQDFKPVGRNIPPGVFPPNLIMTALVLGDPLKYLPVFALCPGGKTAIYVMLG